ncbi:MAG: hypothetical protein ACRCX2_22760 [Paraclostridium sp.]
MERAKVEFRTLRSSKKSNTGNILIATQSKTGDIIFEMAKLKAFNEAGKPTFDYSKKTIFGLSDIEASKIALAMNRFLSNPGAYVNYYTKPISLQHHTASTPKNINFTFSLKENSEQKMDGQLQVNVYHVNDKSNYNIYLNEEEIYALKAVLDSQINPTLKKMAISIEDGYKFREHVASKLG